MNSAAAIGSRPAAASEGASAWVRPWNSPGHDLQPRLELVLNGEVTWLGSRLARSAKGLLPTFLRSLNDGIKIASGLGGQPEYRRSTE